MSGISPNIYAALDHAHGAELVTDADRLTAGFGAWLSDPAARAARRRCRARDGGRLRRRARAHACNRSIPI